ncbi:hypothetical protein EUX98_g8767 [Antrodiella citrinella]|uniref:Peptidase A1 domain-containing protein n=1 Tax=Antrodiella citrinella TaxID=2447956 RepID=A0A4V3XG03_9APHY|nr:hypothetical protein EUX98_g8767 [Antrodiella citrinella]
MNPPRVRLYSSTISVRTSLVRCCIPDFSITADNFNLGTETSGSSQCVGALSGQDLGLGAGVWLLGDSFMKNVYTVFDVSQNAVGFAELK